MSAKKRRCFEMILLERKREVLTSPLCIGQFILTADAILNAAAVERLLLSAATSLGSSCFSTSSMAASCKKMSTAHKFTYNANATESSATAFALRCMCRIAVRQTVALTRA